MKLFLACCFDRHTDPVIRPFDTLERAVAFARKFMEENMAHPEGIREALDENGHVTISYEYAEDHAYTEAVELNDDEQP
jgi:hypothetical protein